MADVQELNERFSAGDKKLEPDMVTELQSIMRMHDLSVQDLFFKWESYCIKMDINDTTLSVESVRALKRDIQDALERENRNLAQTVKFEKNAKSASGTPRNVMRNAGDVSDMLDGLIPNTPAGAKLGRNSGTKRKFETPSITRVKGPVSGSSPDHKSPLSVEKQLESMATPTSFNDRQNPGELIEVLNDHIKPITPVAPYAESRIKLTAASDQRKLAYKPLAMKSSEASEILDDRIDELLALVKEHYELDEAMFGNAAAQSTSEIYAVGRIASDSAEGKLNAASLVLETSRKTGGGRRVPLNLKQLPGYQLFPGQIVALKGSNTSGSEFVVKEALSIPLLPNAASAAATLEAHRDKLRGGPDAMESDDEPPPLNIMLASGPYTADDNLDFEPLHALCSQAEDTYADALVLCGPFVDVDHPSIASGDFDLPDEAQVDLDTATMATVFKYLISPPLNRLAASNPSITILLVPSVRDVIDKHVSWPQDVFSKKEPSLGLPKAARIIGNPMTLSLNEMVMGISSQDALWSLRHEELVGGRPADTQLLSRLPRYLIEQRHYFPVFPPTDRRNLPKVGTEEGVPTGAMMDTSYLRLGDMINVRPDVLVVPSALPPFAKVVESVLVINPGYLSKRKGAGTYARMTLMAPRVDGGDGGLVSHRVFERARVEITRI